MMTNNESFPVGLMAARLGVSPSGFYKWKQRKGSNPREEVRLRLLRAIEDIHRSSRKTYGSPRVLAQLKALGFRTSKSTVERLMRENKIRAKIKRKFRITTESKHELPVSPNHLDRNFTAFKANQVWASDITYIPTKEGWLFLAVIIDLYSRQVVGWQMGPRITKELTLGALKMAIKHRNPGAGLLHHSDRGSQYACAEYRRLLKGIGAISSMSRKGNCWDNAVVESFFHTLKTEMTYFEDFETRTEAKNKIFEWVECFYNRTRIHSYLGFRSPVQFELDKQGA
jgi:putative transposase